VFNGDASDFGTSTTVPAALIDGNTTSGGWSNHYSKGPIQTLNEVTNARAGDWVSVSWPSPQTFGELRPYFTVDAADQLPATVRVLLERAEVGRRSAAAGPVRGASTSRRRSR
jgi:beta-galactosidase